MSRLMRTLACTAVVVVVMFGVDSRTVSTTPGIAAAPGHSKSSAAALPPLFVPNRGQFPDTAQFGSQGRGYRAFFERDGVSFRFDQANLRLRFVNASSQSTLHGEIPQTARMNYIRGNDASKWLSNVPAYGQVTYDNVWPGIDLRFKGAAGTFKYEFVVKPGAHPSDISLAYEGARSLALDVNGNLMIETESRSVMDTRPVAFLEGASATAVDARFALGANGAYHFDVGPYDSARTLVIDPGIVYATYLGGVNDDVAYAIAADAAGNTYIAGYANSGFPTTPGAYDTTNNGTADAFVAKLDPEGSHLIYSTFIGGNTMDIATFLAVDAAGAVYVAGHTRSFDFPTTPGAFQRSHGGTTPVDDVFLLKLDSSGSSLAYSTYLGGASSEHVGGLAIDPNGNAFLTGYSDSADFPVTPGAFDATPRPGRKAFVTKMNASGSALVYSTFLADQSSGAGIVLDASGRTFVSGDTSNAGFPTTLGAFQRTFSEQGTDAYLAELNPQGTALLYSTFFGGAGIEQGVGVGVAGGNVYLAINTTSANLPTTPDAVQPMFQSANPGMFDGFVAAFAQDWSLKFATYLGGDGVDVIYGVASGVIGMTLTGSTRSSNFPVTPGGVSQTLKGTGEDAFVSGFRSSGTPYYSTYVGGNGFDSGLAVALDSRGRFYLAGVTTSTDFPTYTGAFQRQAAGLADPFVARIVPNESISVNKPTTASSVENSSLGPQNATDGNAKTRWSSAFSDAQWIQIDLGKQSFINRIVLHWEEAYASAYQLQLSSNQVDWFTVATVTGGNGGIDEFEGEDVFHEELPPVRYVRLNLQQRATPWGYSLWEFDVYGAIVTNQPPVVTLTSPTDRASYPRPATIPLRADASDPDGTITKVDFWANEFFIATDTTAPYAFDWTNVPPGTYRIFAAATDNGGTVISSKAVTVTVASGPPAPPGTNLALNRPASSSSVEGPAFLPGYAFDGSMSTRWSSQFQDDQTLVVDLGQPFQIKSIVLKWEAAYAKTYEIYVSTDGGTWSLGYFNSAGQGGTETIALNSLARYVRLFARQRATPYGFSLWEFEVYGDPPSSPGTNVARGKATTASSSESAAFPPSNAVDGQQSTRWSSAFADRQWITVDLGATYNLHRVILTWEGAYASQYALQISNDGVTWNTFRSVSKSSNGVDDLGVSAVGRYVRMFAFTRGTPWGVSLWEFEVYGFPVSFGANLARSGTATASSIETSSFTPDKAIDGNLATRWSSAFADGQSIVIDLGSVQPVRRVILRWEAAYAQSYLLQYSNNPAVEGYFTVASQSNGQGGVEDWAWNTEATARYIRVYCATRATPYGCSLFEVEAYAIH